MSDQLAARRWGGLTAVLAVTVAGTAVITSNATAAERPYVLPDGHVDAFEVTVEVQDEEPVAVLQVKDDTRIYDPAPVFREPGDVTFVVDDPAVLRTVPNNPAYSFLGEPDVDEVYLLPQSLQPGLRFPWMGWSTERLTASLQDAGYEAVGDYPVTLDIVVDGPGQIHSWMVDEEGQPINRYVQGNGGTIPITAHAHVHTAWGITAPGDYYLEVTPRVAVSKDSETTNIEGPTALYHLRVEDLNDPDPGDPEPGDPDPGDPDPGDPEPGDPDPGDPDPSDPDPSGPDEQGVVLHRGHIDLFEVTYASGGLRLLVKDDTRLYDAGIVFRDPADVVVSVDEELSYREVPDNPDYAFLGSPGDVFYGLPEVQNPQLPWPGWSTERLAGTLPTGTSVSQVRLDIAVDGPGDVYTWQSGSFGGVINRYVSGSSGTIEAAVPAHVHTNWAFTELGTYTLTVTARATTNGGATLTSPATPYTIQVGPAEDRPSGPLPASALLPDAQLVEENRGGLVAVPDALHPGGEVRLQTQDVPDGDWLMPVFYSDPVQTSWSPVTGGGVVTTVPESLAPGRHKLAAYTADGELVGWAPFTVVASAGGDNGNDDDDARDDDGDPPPTGDTALVCIPTEIEETVETGPLSGIEEGHFDFGSVVEGGNLVARIKDDRRQPASWVDPSSLTFRLGAASRQTVPEGSEFSFLGSAGSTIWVIGQTQEPNVPWLGWNTQHPSLIQGASGPVTFTLDSVAGPGRLAVYATGSFGGVGTRYFGDVAGFPSRMTVTLNQHVHANWAFTEPGTYRVTMTQSATSTGGGTISDTATMTFSVGDSGGTTTQTRWVGRTADGEECELSEDQLSQLATTGSEPWALGGVALTALLGGSLLVAVSRRARRVRA